jgi:RNA polymerase-binding transcription factor DksA
VDTFLVTQAEVLHRKLQQYGDIVRSTAHPPSHAAHIRVKREVGLPAVERALVKIREGRYHVCDMCGGDIPRKRLELIPAAVYCVDCQQEHDRYA